MVVKTSLSRVILIIQIDIVDDSYECMLYAIISSKRTCDAVSVTASQTVNTDHSSLVSSNVCMLCSCIHLLI